MTTFVRLCDRASAFLELNFVPIVLGQALIALVVSSFLEEGQAFSIFIWSLLMMFLSNLVLRMIARLASL